MQTPDHSQLQEIVRRALLPAILGGAGGGALSAYTASKANPQGETPEMRRKRILRNALIGVGLGGAAGAAIPTGWNMLTEPYFGAPPPSNLVQRGSNFLAGNAGTALVGAGAVGGLRTLAHRDRTAAMKHLVGIARGTPGLENEEKLKAYLGGGNHNTFIDNMVGNQGTDAVATHKARMNLNDVLSQAGFKTMSIEDMTRAGGPVSRNPAATNHGLEYVRQALKERLMEARHPWVPEGVHRWATPTGWMSQLADKSIGGVSMTPLAKEFAERYARPGTKMLNNRMGWGARGALAGGAVLAGKSIWDSLTGN